MVGVEVLYHTIAPHCNSLARGVIVLGGIRQLEVVQVIVPTDAEPLDVLDPPRRTRSSGRRPGLGAVRARCRPGTGFPRARWHSCRRATTREARIQKYTMMVPPLAQREHHHCAFPDPWSSLPRRYLPPRLGHNVT